MRLSLNKKVPCRYSQAVMGSSPPHRTPTKGISEVKELIVQGQDGCLPLFSLPLQESVLPWDHLPNGLGENHFFKSPASVLFQRWAQKLLEILLWFRCLLPEFLPNEKPNQREIIPRVQKRHESSHLLEPRSIQFTDILNGPFLLHRHFS